MMNGPEKSDSAIVAKKPANKAGVPVAERVERRAGTKGNAGQPRTHRTPCRGRVSLGLARIRTATLPSNTRGRSRMLELGTFGSVRGVPGNGHSYRKPRPSADVGNWKDATSFSLRPGLGFGQRSPRSACAGCF